MNRFYHTRTPVFTENEADKDIARIAGNPYHAELMYRKCRIDLSLVFRYTESIINDMNNTAIPCVSVTLTNGLNITVMDTYDAFTVPFDLYHVSENKEAIVYSLPRSNSSADK